MRLQIGYILFLQTSGFLEIVCNYLILLVGPLGLEPRTKGL